MKFYPASNFEPIVNGDIHSFDDKDAANHLYNKELGIGTAARLYSLESSDELEGTRRECNFFISIQDFCVACGR